MSRWIETFPVPEESPARYVRDLRFSIGGGCGIFPLFFEYTAWFTNVEKVTLLGDGMFDILEPEWIPSLPRSVTSLTFGPHWIATEPVWIRDVAVELSTFDDQDDWLLTGPLVLADRRTLFEIESILRGRLGGQLRLFGEDVSGGVVDMLLGFPTGLHFMDLQVRSLRECLLSTVMLAEACSKTLVKLSYRVSFHRRSHSLLLVQPALARNTDTDVASRRRWQRGF